MNYVDYFYQCMNNEDYIEIFKIPRNEMRRMVRSSSKFLEDRIPFCKIRRYIYEFPENIYNYLHHNDGQGHEEISIFLRKELCKTDFEPYHMMLVGLLNYIEKNDDTDDEE